MDGSPSVLHCGVTQDGDLASIGIDLDIHDMRGKGATHTTWLRRRPPGDRSTHARHLCGHFLEGHRLPGILGALEDAIGVRHIVGGDAYRSTLGLSLELFLHLAIPATGQALLHLPQDIQRCLMGGIPSCERCTAAARDIGKANAIGTDYRRTHILVGYTKRFGGLHGDRGPRATNVSRPLNQRHRTICVDIDHHRRLEAHIEPEARGHTTTAVRSSERRRIVLMFQRSVHRLQITNTREGRPINPPVPFLGSIETADLQGIHAELFGQFVHHRL